MVYVVYLVIYLFRQGFKGRWFSTAYLTTGCGNGESLQPSSRKTHSHSFCLLEWLRLLDIRSKYKQLCRLINES
jgi:hypothetical protein